MTVKQLKDALSAYPDDTQIIGIASEELFITSPPCIAESISVSGMQTYFLLDTDWYQLSEFMEELRGNGYSEEKIAENVKKAKKLTGLLLEMNP